MAIRKYGAPATSHVRLITAEDVEVVQNANKELSKTEKDSKKKKIDGENKTTTE